MRSSTGPSSLWVLRPLLTFRLSCGRGYARRVLPDLYSARLRLIAVSDHHRDYLVALNADPGVMRHITGRPATPAEVDQEWTQRRGPRSDVRRGLGYWLGFVDGAFAGWWGLGVTSWDDGTANLGYRLVPERWGQGLATEGAQLLLGYAFTTLALTSVWASTLPANAASIAVLNKLAFRCVESPIEGSRTYQLTRDEWAKARPRP